MTAVRRSRRRNAAINGGGAKPAAITTRSPPLYAGERKPEPEPDGRGTNASGATRKRLAFGSAPSPISARAAA
uniref:DUF1534 domain-containing protein n=1 Tax=Angiostrongylus cantonensis TaxID=6313 RepID=A0A0K0CWV0_ANGCA